ncbi:hypothetical protein [Candidatus Uabimicrobium sp. HlEnr_7]|uniref:hypothetical protein n=1 Tax=Candidatus Uabimicrobium helgolandensis TaxID=3095367 RepID=UPI003557CA03
MKRFIICLLLFSAFLTAQAPLVNKVALSPSAVSSTTMWSNKATLKPQVFADNFFKTLSKEYYVERLDKIFEEVISERKDPRKKSITVQKKVYFFAKSTIDYYPEVLVAFKVTTVDYPDEMIKNPKVKVFPMVTIQLDGPCKLYTDHFDFAMDKFDIRSISLTVSAKSTGAQWSVQQVFSLKNLFIIDWLSSVKKTLHFSTEPKVHPVLLFFKQRFSHISHELYTKLK